MLSFVSDASVTLSWYFQDETAPYTEALLTRLIDGESTAVPSHWAIEVLNGVVQGKRRGRIDETTVKQFFESLRSLEIVTEDRPSLTLFEATRTLAERHRLTAYDAAYLELAVRSGLPLATLDDALRKAARSEGVTVL
jgi:predicted nucleic acid-binding protein